MADEDWERHYDTLLWTITAIFGTAIGGLLTYVSSNKDFWLSLFGLVLTGALIYMAASFRWLRHYRREKKKVDSPRKKNLNVENPLRQWPVYVFIFWALGLFWIRLIANTCSEFWCIFIAVAAAWSAYAGIMATIFYKPLRRS